MAARAEKVAERTAPLVVLTPPKVEKDYIVPLGKFDFEEAFSRAQTKEGYWFRAQSDDMFVLFVGMDRKGGTDVQERVSASLYMVTHDFKLRLVGFLDVQHISGQEGLKAACCEPALATASGNPYIEAADPVRETKVSTKVGYWIDEELSKTRGPGKYGGMGRFLLTVHGLHAQRSGIRKFEMKTPTIEEFETLRDFYCSKGAKALTVTAPEKKGEPYSLGVDLDEVKFSGAPAIGKNGFTFGPTELPPSIEAFKVQGGGTDSEKIVIPFRDFRVDNVTISLAKSKEGLRIRMSSGDVFAVFIRENELDLGLESNKPLKSEYSRFREVTVNIFHEQHGELVPAAFCDRTLFNIDEELFTVPSAAEMLEEFKERQIELIGEKKSSESWELKDANGKEYYGLISSRNGTITIFRKGVTHAETSGPPLVGSDLESPAIRDMDAQLREKMPVEPGIGRLGYGAAANYSSHSKGRFSGARRFALVLQDLVSKHLGVETVEVYVPERKGEEGSALRWAQGVYGDAVTSHPSGQRKGFYGANLLAANLVLREITRTGKQKTLKELQ